MTDLGALLRPLPRERLHERVIAQLKHLIASAQIEAGQKLPPERTLVTHLGVSRVVVREALRSLEQAGLVEIKPGAAGGAFVTAALHKPLSNSVRDLVRGGKLTAQHFFDARRAVECASVALAAERASAKDIARLRAINRRLLDDLDDNTRLREHNAAFHLAIAEISENALIKLLVESLMDLLNTVYPRSRQSRDFIQDTFDRHEGIIAALEQGNLSLCQELMARDTAFTTKLEDAADRRQDGDVARQPIT
ncbi:MAG: FadR/GntR family transcriptional regulator [Candidatus Rokuibacteriota bacterium]